MEYIIFSLFSALILCLLAEKNMKRTLYSFWNVMIWAGILFFGITLVEELSVIIYEKIRTGRINDFPKESHKLYSTFAFSHIVLIVIAAICVFLIVSNISLIRHEGKRISNLYGTFLGVAFLISTGILHVLADNYISNMMISFLFLLLSYAECITGAIIVMGYIASKQIPRYDKDYIIILGCSISKEGGLLPLLKQRTNRAIKYAWEQEMATGKPLKYVPSGGQGEDEIMSEGSAMALYLESHGAEAYEVYPEKQSRNTFENFLFSKKIIDKLGENAKTAFATTNYHVFRAGMLARKAGFEDIEAISSKTKWYFWPNGFAREIMGIFAMTWRWHVVSVVILFFIEVLLKMTKLI